MVFTSLLSHPLAAADRRSRLGRAGRFHDSRTGYQV